MLDLYDRAVDALGVDVEERWVETRHGRTHLLVTGPPEGPPLMLFHGGNALNPLSLAWFRPLAREWRIHAPDTIGHPGKSAETRLDPDGDGYGRWTVGVLDALEIDRVSMVGPSYGAAIILRAAAVAPERIERAALVVPAGIAPPRRLGILRLALPLLGYRLAPNPARLRRAAAPLFTEPPPDLWLEALDATVRHVRIEHRIPRPASRGGLSGLSGPTLVIAAEKDVLFPGREVLPRAEEVLPGRVEGELLAGSRHVPSVSDLRWVNERIVAFLG